MSSSESDLYLIALTAHWRVTHRRDARYPGYLMVSSREDKTELSELSAESLRELGDILAASERLLYKVYNPQKVIFYKLGFSPGFCVHFHVAPVTAALLDEIRAHPAYADDPDGNDAILFLSRIYCERDLSDAEVVAMKKEIARLRVVAKDFFGAQHLIPSEKET